MLPTKRDPRLQDLTGREFGRLRVLGFSHVEVIPRAGRIKRTKRYHWNCQCTCGSLVRVHGANLRSDTRSCGCLQRERSVAANTTHGAWGGEYSPLVTKGREFRIWTGMRSRCYDTNDPNFPRYGGRGITVCERWRRYENFLADMGPAPPRMSIERKQVNGHYEPGNCCWATFAEQGRNKRSTRFITFQDRTRTLTEWATAIGLSRPALADRLGRRGWTLEKALTTPPRAQRRARPTVPSR